MMLSQNSGRVAAIFGAVVLAVAGLLLWLGAGKGEAQATRVESQSRDVLLPAALEDEAMLAVPPPPAPRTREQKRFARIDRDDDSRITQPEYLVQRRRNYDKLDTNADGRLTFEEYAVSGIEKFRTADANGNGNLSPPEFATTAAKTRSTQSATGKCEPCAMASNEER